ncbi:hypothetical protein FDF29_06445 [Clostridium botulinum]|uniref:Hypothetical phage protein n=1 Tax=Clostridium botulinum (strain Hall / ATCC 3502 / NCTC 13319 / Type A) TaxID=441771 RepID=A5I4D4_CLOBH|nr:YopX family protein [Clostridium botulinum]NFL68452.1 hypothetical protein [Clostridium botulinum]NFQ52997.1 hypothetical protein [Clostridium botulinum]NFT45889.1 hypothetical protein [Clostridium botulinum]QGT41827.1 hypothetical protein GJ703_00004 [Clostridium botulinum]CAL83906.1 hypothetical phage protein [Clostridium botulinum A str. ATCC 3502]
MREIKFRAWDKIDEKIREITLIDFEYKKVKLLNDYTGESYLRDFEEVILLEYTGLKDKNGKEIYEGNILHIEIKDKSIKDKIIASSNEVVKYKDCKFGVVWGWHRDFIGLDGFYNTAFQVIGNVYEDPKLLQEGLNGQGFI